MLVPNIKCLTKVSFVNQYTFMHFCNSVVKVEMQTIFRNLAVGTAVTVFYSVQS
jgi:hypothetical protein